MRNTFVTLVLAGIILTASGLLAEDWPQWRGPRRDGKSLEAGLLKTWPAGGPEELWSYDKLGEGFSTIAIAGGTIYTTGMKGKTGYLYALSLDGKPRWAEPKPYGPDWEGSHKGARSTPTVYDGKVYVMSGYGRLCCFDAATGDRKWAVDTFKKFGGRNFTWGVTESVLVDDNNVICTPGGRRAAVVALNRKTGKTVWTSKDHGDLSAYCSPLRVRDKAMDLIVTCTANSVVALAPETGELLWRVPLRNKYSVHPNTPIYWDGHIYITTGYDGKGMLLKLSPDGKKASRLWTDTNLNVHHGGAIRVGDYVYGASYGKKWVCLDLHTGKPAFQPQRVGKGSLTFADDMLYFYEEKSGMVSMVKPSAKKYEAVSRFRIQKGSGKHWAHPVVHGGRLYIRHGAVLMAFDIKEE